MDIKDRYEAYEKANRIHHIADEETAERLRCKVGDAYTTFPPPDTKEKAWKKLKEYTSLIHLESLVKQFKRDFPINLRTLNDELEELQKFINEAETYSTVDAFKPRVVYNQIRYSYEYLKLKYDYYKNKEFTQYDFFSPDAEFVYGKYFVYKKWLEDRIRELKPKERELSHHQLQYDVRKRLEAELDITIFEKLRRELNSYHWIFTSQFTKQTDEFHYPMIHNDGVYCPSIEIHTNSKLNKIEKYKSHYIKRFEKGKRKTAVENELLEIYKKAVAVRNYYNENLTNLNPVVDEISKAYLVDMENRERFHLHAIIDQFNVTDIYFNQDMNQHFINVSKREFHYPVLNKFLAEFCQSLIDFIDNFEIEKIKQLENSDVLVTTSTEINLHNNIFKYNAFEIFEKYKTLKLVTKASRTDLRVIYELLKADNLFVETVELKHYIKWLNETYFDNDLGTELKVQNMKSKSNIIRSNEYKEIRDTTLKQPEKRSKHTAG